MNIQPNISLLTSWKCYDHTKKESVNAQIIQEPGSAPNSWNVRIVVNGETIGSGNAQYVDKCLHIEIMRNDNSDRYSRVGSAIHAAMANIALRHNINEITLDASWNSHAFHIRTGGFVPEYDVWIRKAWRKFSSLKIKKNEGESKEDFALRQKAFVEKKEALEAEKNLAQEKGIAYLKEALPWFDLANAVAQGGETKADIRQQFESGLGKERKSEIEENLAKILGKEKIDLEAYVPLNRELTEKIIQVWDDTGDTTHFNSVPMYISQEMLDYYRNLFANLPENLSPETNSKPEEPEPPNLI